MNIKQLLVAGMMSIQALLPVQQAPVAEVAHDPLMEWINKLAFVESSHRENIKILDSNNKFSYGCMQFQMATFRRYVERYELLPSAEDVELENMIYDCEFQKKLAYMMISEDPRNINHWKNSLPKIK